MSNVSKQSESKSTTNLVNSAKTISNTKTIEWRPFPVTGIEDKYMVSNDGQVKSLITGKIMSCSSIRGGYKSVSIGSVHKTFKVHQLVANAFIPRTDPLKNIVNHKDGNKLHNTVDNLEWTTLGENTQHALDTGLTAVTTRAVYQCDLQGTVIKKHDTIRGAGKDTGVDSGGIAKCCKGTLKQSGGFIWKFVDVNPNEGVIDTTDYIPVKDFKNYLINKEGNVYSVPYKKIMKQQANNDGYLGIQLSNDGNRISYLVHRLVAMHFVTQPKGKDYVSHKDGNKLNNHADNLEWLSSSESNSK